MRPMASHANRLKSEIAILRNTNSQLSAQNSELQKDYQTLYQQYQNNIALLKKKVEPRDAPQQTIVSARMQEPHKKVSKEGQLTEQE